MLRSSSVVQFILSLIASIGLIGLAGLVFILGLIQRLDTTKAGVDSGPMFLSAAGLGFLGILLLPSCWYALLDMRHRPARFYFPWGKRRGILIATILLLIVLPLSILVGWSISRLPAVSWLFLPPFHILAVSLPVLWLLTLGMLGLPTGTPQRFWGIFSSGLVLGPFIIMIVEILAIGVIGAAWFFVFINQEGFLSDIMILSRQMSGAPNQEVILNIITPYLIQPGTILTGFFFASVLVPLIEELIKPIGVWLLAGKKLTPAEGFTAGAVSGAGYALFESLGYASLGGEQWSVMVTTRIATAVLHIFTTALIGWAIASAWEKARYLKLAFIYMAGVFIHGSWNALALLGFTAADLPAPFTLPPSFQQIGSAAIILLGILCLSVFGMYILINRRLNRSLQQEPPGFEAVLLPADPILPEH